MSFKTVVFYGKMKDLSMDLKKIYKKSNNILEHANADLLLDLF